MNVEWLEADGMGGFASGTVSTIRTRRYHALLLAATAPPTGRVVLVNGLEAWVETLEGAFPLSSHRYSPDVVHPDGHRRIVEFTPDPWPRWRYRLDDGREIGHELLVPRGEPAVVLRWHIEGSGRFPSARGDTLCVRPLLSGRNHHHLHRENPQFRFQASVEDSQVTWCPYPDLPSIRAASNGHYVHQPEWYRNFLYEDERARGLDHLEDLASPGIFRCDLARGAAVLILSAGGPSPQQPDRSERAGWFGSDPVSRALDLRHRERGRREGFPTRLHRAADAYIVRRGAGRTVVAGYPWFTDWGRDTFIALRGLGPSTGRPDDARDVLLAWSETISEGMLPNRFPDRPDEEPEFNSVDASLWYVIAVGEFLARTDNELLTPRQRQQLLNAVEAILQGYAAGTRYGIRLDEDGLIAAGEPGQQLTWMDAKVRDWVVTPRIGKPVEVQALWLNALRLSRRFGTHWRDVYERGIGSFQEKFWNEADRCLYDVIDVDHRRGTVDASLRPNQILAVGGLPEPLLTGDRAREVVETLERRLWTPLGLRTLDPGNPDYRGRYQGGVLERDAAYHQGTAWPWLLGPFVEAWVRGHGDTSKARREACRRFVEPVLTHLDDAGLGHVSEIADGDSPHTPRGCPFQAWSVGEILRLLLVVLQSSGT